jgi:hypothetical protein
MHLIKKSVVIICLIAFAISTTGISMQKHSCQMTGKTKVAWFPEIFGKNTTCCEPSSPVNSNNSNSIRKVPCCNNITKYAKVTSLYNNPFSAGKLIKIFLNIPEIHLFQNVVKAISHNISLINYRPPPIQFFGITLLHFIHNIKSDLPC